jgi:hypothetical protein
MTTRFTGGVFLLHADSLNPQFPALAIGRSLAESLKDTVEAPLPERLAELLRQLEDPKTDAA